MVTDGACPVFRQFLKRNITIIYIPADAQTHFETTPEIAPVSLNDLKASMVFDFISFL